MANEENRSEPEPQSSLSHQFSQEHHRFLKEANPKFLAAIEKSENLSDYPPFRRISHRAGWCCRLRCDGTGETSA